MFHRYSFAKKSQSQTLIREKLLNLFLYEKRACKHVLKSISPTFNEQLLRQFYFAKKWELKL